MKGLRKRLISIMLTLLIVITLIPIGGAEVKASVAGASQLQYIKINDSGYYNNIDVSSICTYDKNSTTLTIYLSNKSHNTGVVTIGDNVFTNCKKLKTIKINSMKLKKVWKSAIKGINGKAKIKVPAKKVKKYMEMFN